MYLQINLRSDVPSFFFFMAGKKKTEGTPDRRLSINIPKNHQKIYRTAQNIDMWDEHRDS